MSVAYSAEMERRAKEEKEFWKGFPAMADYFSHAVTSMQDYLGMNSKEIFSSLGGVFGKKAAEKFDSSVDLTSVLKSLTHMWQDYGIGRLEIANRNPLTLIISDCTICGQLAGSGENYECAFHEGFFKSLLSSRQGREVNLVQETNYEGDAGTWCRQYVAPDVKLEDELEQRS
jgi:predicted hydrocarbon binding protein